MPICRHRPAARPPRPRASSERRRLSFGRRRCSAPQCRRHHLALPPTGLRQRRCQQPKHVWRHSRQRRRCAICRCWRAEQPPELCQLCALFVVPRLPVLHLAVPRAIAARAAAAASHEAFISCAAPRTARRRQHQLQRSRRACRGRRLLRSWGHRCCCRLRCCCGRCCAGAAGGGSQRLHQRSWPRVAHFQRPARKFIRRRPLQRVQPKGTGLREHPEQHPAQWNQRHARHAQASSTGSRASPLGALAWSASCAAAASPTPPISTRAHWKLFCQPGAGKI